MTDSAHDLPGEILQKLPIKIAPMMVYFGDDEFKDGVTLTTEQFYGRFLAGPHLPKTATPLLVEMRQQMQALTEDGSELVVILLASGLSATYANAVMLAEEMPDRRITVIDSRSASLGEGLLILQAAEMAAAGADAAAIAAALEARIPRLVHLFTVDTLEYLMKGGRITRIEAFVGSVLDVKPIMILDEEGRIVPLGKVRGRRKALAQLASLAGDGCTDPAAQTIGVIHAHCRTEGAEFAAAIRERLAPKEILFSQIGPTIGAHVGPGLMGVVFERAEGRSLTFSRD